ncbi:hypothetical protein BDP27DRAFT_399818 [Rhodocollybia butyracea]|uniref:Uncharacterized protein n=1 Tax=Rhodocollybia butyracea TaxID=206335 RepID=A0A9P5PUG8_9AGAR|nr:hypothetical protein BDP27DRAFT_399818 [Rhodocollybia butyracea]
MASAFIALIGIIGDLITVVGGFQSLFPSNSQNLITLQDFQRLLRQENVSFFTQVEVARLQSTRLNFYNVWLPAVSQRTVINANDIDLPSGEFYHVFTNLRDAILEVHMRVETLASVFRQNTTVLQIDDFVQGMFLMMELYGLLLHMHAVWATLRRIQVGASSLDDPRLNVDTRSAIMYASSARTFVEEMRELSWNLRRNAVEAIQSEYRYIGAGSNPSYYYVYSFSDLYSPLPNALRPLTTAIGSIVLPRSYRRSTLEDSNASSWISQARNSHLGAIQAIYDLVTNEGPKFLTKMDKLLNMLQNRLALQGGVRGLDKLLGVNDVYDSEKEEKEALLEVLSIHHEDDGEEAT